MAKQKADIWMPFYIGDYLADTIGLDYAEHGAYILALFAYWRKGGALTDQEMKKTVREHYDIVTSFFEDKEGLWHHKRVNQEIEKTQQVSKSLSIRGKAGADKRWQNNGQSMQQPCNSHDLANAQAMLGDAQSHSKSQPQSNTESDSNSETLSVEPEARRLPKFKAEATEIFDYWKTELGHQQAILNDKREKAIKARLAEGYTVERIKQAIRGIQRLPHNMGQNERNTVYDDIELICRSGVNVDRFADSESRRPFDGFKKTVSISHHFKKAEGGQE